MGLLQDCVGQFLFYFLEKRTRERSCLLQVEINRQGVKKNNIKKLKTLLLLWVMCDAEVVHVRQEGTRTLPLSVKTSSFHTHYNPEMENEIMCM